MNKFKKVLGYLLLAVAVLMISLVGSAFLFKDRIINQFILKANEQLNTPVKIGKIEVSVFESFPNISIIFNEVYVEDSHQGKYPLLTAKKVSFRLNPIEVYRGQYIIKGLVVVDSETSLKIDANGENNYTITKESSESGPVRFELKNILLTNTRVRYHHLKQNEDLIFTSERLYASIQTSNNEYDIDAKGDVTTEKLFIDGHTFLEGKSFSVTTALVYDDHDKTITLEPSDLLLKTSSFTVKGNYDWKGTPLINMSIEGRDTDIQTLLSLLPEKSAGDFTKYQSSGDVYFNALLKGEISEKKAPSLTVEFGFTKATISHPETGAKIQNASMEGSFATSSFKEATLAVLSLKNIQGNFNNKPFTSNLVIRNFKDSDVILDFKGALDAGELLSFYPIESVKQASGTLIADISFEGRVSWLKNKATAQRTSTQGMIEIKDANLLYGRDEVPLKSLNGLFQFNNNDLALSDVTGTLGTSDFKLNGLFKNIITFLLFENQQVGIEADLKSNHLNLDELFAFGFGKEPGNTEEYEFRISPNLNLNFNCNVNSLQYKRFSGQSLTGDLLVKNQFAVSRNINLYTMGGNLSLSGIVDAKNPKAIAVSGSFKLNGLQADSIFYVFENFGQTFIRDTHLKGNAFADVSLDFKLNQNLKLYEETLIADISAVIKNGELNNFEPLKQLNKYLDDEGLNALRFGELKNDIHIENKTVYIPQMQVLTNVTVLQISGTHTFDQHIDYRIITPLSNKRKIDITEAGNAIEEMDGRAKLYLKITGTTENYTVQYDKDAVKGKIIADLKKEVQELKDIFKIKQKKKEIELSKEEFDWDN
ncbi:MAG: hypothetical protein OEU76_06715 [Cyclobacteriaceae bacterium]|nr:hypothetical protein [Cyclobacteriaceae bacterium]